MFRQQSRKIVELGLGMAQRAARMIDVAARYAPREEIHYIGIDPFEDRSAAETPGLTLINAHRLLKPTGARIRLIPGNPWEALIRSANHIGPVDLLIISADGRQSEPFPQFWSYVPRLLHPKTVVFREILTDGGAKGIEEVDYQDLIGKAAALRVRAA
jgi:hypothetical protein